VNSIRFNVFIAQYKTSRKAYIRNALTDSVTEDKPVAAIALSLIAGALVVTAGFVVFFLGAIITFFIGGVGAVFGAFGIACGALIILGAVMLYNKPEQHIVWSMVILVFSVFSIFGAFGGFVIGTILGVIGAVFGLSFNPPIKYCPKCRAKLKVETNFCPNCGTDLRKC
jgi:hypothetical protein